jgi:hypothetical protein
VAVIVGVLLSLGGGGSRGTQATNSTASRSSAKGAHAHGARHARGSAAASPAATHVVVLNSTETNGLAHHLSASLQQSGYTQAAALQAHPPEARTTSVVEYTEGHRSEAQRVGQALEIGQVQPLESAVAPLVGSATVVVIAGADKATAVGGETSSASAAAPTGESSAGAEAPAGEVPGGAAQ